MKKGIFVAVAALALSLFAIPNANAWWWWHRGPDLNLRLAGSSFITSTQEDGTPALQNELPFTSMQNGIAKGKRGNAVLTAQTIAFGDATDPNFPDACGGLPGDALISTFVLTYNDGSILSGTTDDALYCFNPVTGEFFTVDFGGEITGGERRFEGATGTWEGTASSVGARLTGEIEIDLD